MIVMDIGFGILLVEVVLAIFFSALVGAYAKTQKRVSLKWFCISLVISPLISFIVLVILPPLSKSELLAQEKEAKEREEELKKFNQAMDRLSPKQEKERKQ